MAIFVASCGASCRRACTGWRLMELRAKPARAISYCAILERMLCNTEDYAPGLKPIASGLQGTRIQERGRSKRRGTCGAEFCNFNKALRYARGNLSTAIEDYKKFVGKYPSFCVQQDRCYCPFVWFFWLGTCANLLPRGKRDACELYQTGK